MSILLNSQFFCNFFENEPFLAKISTKWVKNGQLTLEIALMQDGACALSIILQKLGESAKNPSKNGSK